MYQNGIWGLIIETVLGWPWYVLVSLGFGMLWLVGRVMHELGVLLMGIGASPVKLARWVWTRARDLRTGELMASALAGGDLYVEVALQIGQSVAWIRGPVVGLVRRHDR